MRSIPSFDQDGLVKPRGRVTGNHGTENGVKSWWLGAIKVVASGRLLDF